MPIISAYSQRYSGSAHCGSCSDWPDWAKTLRLLSFQGTKTNTYTPIHIEIQASRFRQANTKVALVFCPFSVSQLCCSGTPHRASPMSLPSIVGLLSRIGCGMACFDRPATNILARIKVGSFLADFATSRAGRGSRSSQDKNALPRSHLCLSLAPYPAISTPRRDSWIEPFGE